MKKLFCTILALCLIIPMGITLTGCGKKPSNNPTTAQIELSYIKNLQLSTTNNTAYGIKKSATATSNTQSLHATNLQTSFVDLKPIVHLKSNRTSNEKNYLYSTTQTYQNGSVEYDTNSIQKVTFTKNTTVTEDVYDSNGYLIESNQTITQEEIPAQINKLYVNEKYMFMQFVPLVTESGNYDYYDNNTLKTEYLEIRPDSLIYNLNGISTFDTTNFYSSALSQSFVIDSITGYIYKIENFKIASVYDIDLVKDENNNTYKMSISSQGSLIFTDIMPNKDVQVYSAVTDKFGYTFVRNDKINETDNENKIIYSTATHMIDNTKHVYLADNSSLKTYVDGIEEDADNNLTTFGLKPISPNLISSLIGYYKGKQIYNFNLETPKGQCGIENSIYVSLSPRLYPTWFDTQSIIVMSDHLLYSLTLNLDNYLNTNTTLTLNDFTKVSEELLYKYTDKYYINVGSDKKQIDNVYYKSTLTGTTYYQLVRNGTTFQMQILEDKTYTQNTFIFQPINKETGV